MEQAPRSTVVKLYRAGQAPAAIVGLLKYPSRTVYSVFKGFKVTGESIRKTHKPKSNGMRTPRFLVGLKRSVDANPSMSMVKLAKKKNVSKATIFRAVKRDLGYKSFKLRVRHLLTTAHKESRDMQLLLSLKSTGGHLVGGGPALLDQPAIAPQLPRLEPT